MRPRSGAALLALAASCFLLAQRPATAQRYVRSDEPAFPKVKYADSLVSANDRCIVKKTKLNPAIRPVYVNWRPIGFC